MKKLGNRFNGLTASAITLTVLFGIFLSLTVFTRDILLWKNLIIMGMVAFGIYDYLKNRRTALLVASFVTWLTVFLCLLPLMVYHKKTFNTFSLAAIPLYGGAQLWNLNEKMIKNSKNAGPQWVTNTVLYLTNVIKSRKGIPESQYDDDSYFNMCSAFGGLGRQGKLINPETNQAISPREFSDIMVKYCLQVNLDNPAEVMKRMINSVKRTYFSENFNYQMYIETVFRKKAEYELAHIHIMAPYSLTKNYSSKLDKLKLSTIEFLKADRWCVDADCTAEYKNSFPLSVDRTTDEAFVYKVSNPNIWWINVMKNFKVGGISLVVFLISLVIFVYRKDFLKLDIMQFYFLGVSLFFVVATILVTYGDSKYSLYTVPTMLLFFLTVLSNNSFKSSR